MIKCKARWLIESSLSGFARLRFQSKWQSFGISIIIPRVFFFSSSFVRVLVCVALISSDQSRPTEQLTEAALCAPERGGLRALLQPVNVAPENSCGRQKHIWVTKRWNRPNIFSASPLPWWPFCSLVFSAYDEILKCSFCVQGLSVPFCITVNTAFWLLFSRSLGGK